MGGVLTPLYPLLGTLLIAIRRVCLVSVCRPVYVLVGMFINVFGVGDRLRYNGALLSLGNDIWRIEWSRAR